MSHFDKHLMPWLLTSPTCMCGGRAKMRGEESRRRNLGNEKMDIGGKNRNENKTRNQNSVSLWDHNLLFILDFIHVFYKFVTLSCFCKSLCGKIAGKKLKFKTNKLLDLHWDEYFEPSDSHPSSMILCFLDVRHFRSLWWWTIHCLCPGRGKQQHLHCECSSCCFLLFRVTLTSPVSP